MTRKVRGALLKIGEVARRAGVSVATVKHYLGEGLLPPATKTHRNMAYYPPAAIERIRLVRELQEKRFLPLKVIRTLLGARGERARRALAALQSDLSGAAARAVAALGEAPVARRDAAAEAAVSAHELAALERSGVVDRRGPDEAYEAIDARILRIVGRLRRAGFTRERGFGAEVLSVYRRAMDDLAAAEVALFLPRVLEKVPAAAVTSMLDPAIDAIGELAALLRKKALSRRVAELGGAAPPAPPTAATPRGARGAGRRAGRSRGRSAT